MSIIGINGYSGSGKDTVGKVIQYLTTDIRYPEYFSIEDILKHIPDTPSKHNPWGIKKWAGKLKTIASILTGIPVEKFEDQQFKNTALGREWCYPTEWQGREHWVEMSVREFLQKLGTEGLRNGLHENIWVNALMADYHDDETLSKLGSYIYMGKPYPPCKWVITDTRFPNEAKAIKERGGIIIRVIRPGIEAINDHPSETSLDDWNFDYVINNDKDIENLIDQMQVIMHKEKLLTYA